MTRFVLISAVATAANGQFMRLGRMWPTSGTVVDATGFTEDQWAILTAEKMLHIGPAPEGAAAVAVEDAALRDVLKATLGALEPGDFEANGKPKLGALKERHPDLANRITAKLLTALWAELNPTK
jgi:hypothetical protein